ncbi:uncharacterized protein ddias isoform X2 [Cynoglossus semilaevis]|uniref:uncharacterized protein ddias isoform X2 n=1 Tax=Cynoglossus semilaevis TaxID=244447 RepID=UPI0007DC9082|nr:DNA damage-induced apoptosis suppressor protein isoform X2 [Cynoglossus semilaevis]
MSVRRALVDCAVLSLHDNTVLYPACKGCFSRINAEQQNGSRCSRCGFHCVREQLEYRYRLSLRVTRGRRIFGVTVFGTCLNSFFGISASGLQRLVENVDGPVAAPTKAELLLKAVKECVIGRHFIFGIKFPGTEGGLSFEEPDPGTDRVQFVATQMILPPAAGLRGCTVVRFYQLLLHRAAEDPERSTDTLQTHTPSEDVLLVSPHSPTTSSSNSTLHTSALASLSLPGFQGSLPPTPPWQRSLGLVTSSAEQDEGLSSSSDDDEGENEGHSSQQSVMTSSALHHQNHSLVLPTRRFCGTSVSTPLPSSDLPSPNLPSSDLLSSDLPFSEALTEFLGNKEIFYKQNKTKKVRTEQGEQSQEENVWTGTTCVQLSQRGHTLECVCEGECVDHRRENSSVDENSYDCSADMFCSPLLTDNNQQTAGTSEPLQLRGQSVNVLLSTPHIFKRKRTKSCCSHLDFSPQVQSTPVLKVNFGFGSPAVGPSSSRRVLSSYNRGYKRVSSGVLLPLTSRRGSVLRTQSGRHLHCRRTLLTRRSTSPGASGTTGCGATSAEQSLDRTDDEKATCDWSRDLFSDFE